MNHRYMRSILGQLEALIDRVEAEQAAGATIDAETLQVVEAAKTNAQKFRRTLRMPERSKGRARKPAGISHTGSETSSQTPIGGI